MKRKILALLLALTLAVSLIPAAYAAEVVDSGHGWYVDWVLTADGTLTISGYAMRDAQSELDAPWSRHTDAVKTIVLSDGLTSVAHFAFTDFEHVEEVCIPESLETIGMSAFAGCTSLTRVDLPAAVRKIDDMAFASCANLTAIEVAGENEHFCDVDGVLMDKTQTTLIQVPAGIAGAYAVPDFVKTVQRSAFMGCDALTSVTFPDHITELPEAVLYGLESLTDVHLPASLTAIPKAAFYGTPLPYLEIPAGVTVIDFGAFDNCMALKDVVFRGDAPQIDDFAFQWDTLTAWYPAGNATWIEEVMQDYSGDITWLPYEPLPFSDVPVGSFYYDSVAWAVENEVTNGISADEFDPTGSCNRAQAVTFLWRAEGSPEPTTAEHPFVDVEAGSFYEKAVLWAVENGITTGTDATHFNPNMTCNRATVVTFLHRAFAEPAVEGAENPFTDVPADTWYTAPVLWAVENGITNGMGGGTFGVNGICNRAQIVTFLYRAYTD